MKNETFLILFWLFSWKNDVIWLGWTFQTKISSNYFRKITENVYWDLIKSMNSIGFIRRIRRQAWYRWIAAASSFQTVLSSPSNSSYKTGLWQIFVATPLHFSGWVHFRKYLMSKSPALQFGIFLMKKYKKSIARRFGHLIKIRPEMVILMYNSVWITQILHYT